MALTEAGRALALAAVEVDVALARAEQAVARFQNEPAGRVSVAAFHSAGLAFFGALLTASSGPGRPRVELSDFDVAQGEFPALTSGHDLVVAHRMAGSPPWPATVRVEPLVFEPLDIVVRKNHRLARKSSIGPDDLRDEGWVAVHEGFPLEGAIAQIGGIAGAEARIVHRINEFFVAAHVVAATDCVALMPRYTAGIHNHPDVVLRPLAGARLGRHIDCLVRPETAERANVVTVLGLLRDVVADLTRTVRRGQS